MHRLSATKPRNRYGTHHSSGLRTANQDQRKRQVNATPKSTARMRTARVGGKTVRTASTLACSFSDDLQSQRNTTPIATTMSKSRRTPMPPRIVEVGALATYLSNNSST